MLRCGFRLVWLALMVLLCTTSIEAAPSSSSHKSPSLPAPAKKPETPPPTEEKKNPAPAAHPAKPATPPATQQKKKDPAPAAQPAKQLATQQTPKKNSAPGTKQPSNQQIEKTPSSQQTKKKSSTLQTEKEPSTQQTKEAPSTQQTKEKSPNQQTEKKPSTSGAKACKRPGVKRSLLRRILSTPDEDCPEWPVDGSAPTMKDNQGAPDVANINKGLYMNSGKWKYTDDLHPDAPWDEKNHKALGEQLATNQRQYYMDTAANSGPGNRPEWKDQHPPVMDLSREKYKDGVSILRGTTDQVLAAGEKVDRKDPEKKNWPKQPDASQKVYDESPGQRSWGPHNGLHGEEGSGAQRAFEGKNPHKEVTHAAWEIRGPDDYENKQLPEKPPPIKSCDGCRGQIYNEEKGKGEDLHKNEKKTPYQNYLDKQKQARKGSQSVSRGRKGRGDRGGSTPRTGADTPYVQPGSSRNRDPTPEEESSSSSELSSGEIEALRPPAPGEDTQMGGMRRRDVGHDEFDALYEDDATFWLQYNSHLHDALAMFTIGSRSVPVYG